MASFIFDIDGTLTPSRDKIDTGFQSWFLNFQKVYDTYLVTGSDRSKTIEQVGEQIYNSAKRVYNCSGSEVWEQDKKVYASEWELPMHVRWWLEKHLEASAFPVKTGLHIEERPGMVNFSIVGRNADRDQRKLYVAWDTGRNERIEISKAFETKFPDIQAKVGGETGIDIFPKGCDKSQILRDFNLVNEIYFFGDRMDDDGNDYPLSTAILEKELGKCYSVKDWKHTWKLLKEIA
jgi:phosphomannomutase